jgi:hypothetical protein
MFKIFIQSNDNYSLNLITNENILNNISHIIYNPIEFYDNNYIKNLFKLKLKNRYLKTLLQIHIDKDLNILECVKTICNYGFDGILFTLENETFIKKCEQIIKTLNKLPEPYNFGWEIYYLHLRNNINIDLNKEFYKNLNGIINFESNKNNDINKINIYNQKQTFRLNSNLYIIEINKNVIELIKQNKINQSDNKGIKKNNINYPTSKFIKNIIDKNEMEVIENKTINIKLKSNVDKGFKRNGIYDIKFDIDFIRN